VVQTVSVGKANPPESDCTTQSVVGANPLLAAIFRLGYTLAPALRNFIIDFGTGDTIVRIFTQLKRHLFKHSKHLVMPPRIFAQALSAIEKNCGPVPFAEQPTALHLSLPATSQRAKVDGAGNWLYVASSINLICGLSNAHNSPYSALYCLFPVTPAPLLCLWCGLHCTSLGRPLLLTRPDLIYHHARLLVSHSLLERCAFSQPDPSLRSATAPITSFVWSQLMASIIASSTFYQCWDLVLPFEFWGFVDSNYWGTGSTASPIFFWAISYTVIGLVIDLIIDNQCCH